MCEKQNYPLFNPASIFKQQDRSSYQLQPFYFIVISEKAHKLRPTLIDSDNYEISSTKCDTSRIYQDLDIARIPTPYCFDRHPSPFTFASTTTGLTNFIEAMSSDHPDPYQLDTPFVPQPTDGTLDPIHHVPFFQHYFDLNTRTNPMLPSYITLMQLYRTI
jgi:hypothetical protein